MANIKQQAKRNRTNEKQRLLNTSFKSSMKTAMKNVEKAVAEQDLVKANENLVLAFIKLDKAVAKGFLHKNNAARNKSRLQKLVNSLK